MHVTLVIEENVLRHQVLVDDVFMMQLLQRETNLHREELHSSKRQTQQQTLFAINSLCVHPLLFFTEAVGLL